MTAQFNDSEGESDTDVDSKSEDDEIDNKYDTSSSNGSEDAVSLISAYLDILKEQKEIDNILCQNMS